MNARIRLSDKMSNKQKENVKQFCSIEMRKQQKAYSRRMIKIFCIALHEVFGFGMERCSRIIAEINRLSTKRDKDEVFWYHVDRELEQMGLTFQSEDYEEMDR